MLNNSAIDKLIEMSLSPMATAIMDRISYDSYKVNIESINPKRDISASNTS